MFNFRSNLIIAGAAFFLSLLVGLVSRTTMPMLIIRPVIFAVVFFIFSILVKILIDRFLPELLEEGSPLDEGFQLGSRIDITDEDPQINLSRGGNESGGSGYSAQAQDILGARPDDSEEDIGDISDLASKGSSSGTADKANNPGMDQNTEEHYTVMGDFGVFAEPALDKMFVQDSFSETPPSQEQAPPAREIARPVESSQPKASAGGTKASYRSEEALPDLDSMAGAFMSTSSGEEPEVTGYSGSSSSKKSSSKGVEWAEDYSGKNMAMGIQTVLKKDKAG